MKTSITRRWIKGNILVTATILILAEIVLSIFIVSSYYDDTRQALITRLENVSGQLLVAGSVAPNERASTLNRMVEEFSEANKFEFMLIGHDGNIVSSSGSATVYGDMIQDLDLALSSDNGIGEYVGQTSRNEPIMSMAMLVPYTTTDIAAIRMVVSLTGVNQAIISSIGLTIFIAIIIFAFSIITGILFVRSIVNPISKIERIATRIAGGDFNVRIDNNYDDEIGRLCATINNMAGNLSESERLKNDFISSISHELRTPLTAIKGWTETLGTVDTLDSANTKKAMKVIGSEADRLTEMVEGLLDFSRIQNSGLVLVKERIDLIAELADAVHIAAGRASAEEVQIVFDEPIEAIVLHADRNRLRQVFLNILDNAVKYSPRQGHIYVAVEDALKKVVVTIEDEGNGIPISEIKNVKEKFYKASGSKKGSGIGLAVVEEILRAHDSDMNIYNRKAGGLGVEITLHKD